jgi:hypothetical protein
MEGHVLRRVRRMLSIVLVHYQMNAAAGWASLASDGGLAIVTWVLLTAMRENNPEALAPMRPPLGVIRRMA